MEDKQSHQMICSIKNITIIIFDQERNNIRNKFSHAGYPIRFIDSEIQGEDVIPDLIILVSI